MKIRQLSRHIPTHDREMTLQQECLCCSVPLQLENGLCHWAQESNFFSDVVAELHHPSPGNMADSSQCSIFGFVSVQGEGRTYSKSRRGEFLAKFLVRGKILGLLLSVFVILNQFSLKKKERWGEEKSILAFYCSDNISG